MADVHTFAAFDQIVMMVLLGGLGLGLRKGKILTDGLIHGLNSLLLLVAQPALLIASTQQQRDGQMLASYLTVAGLSTLSMVAAMALIYALTRGADKGARPVIACAAALPNVGYVGIPIVQATFGQSGIFYLSAFIVGFNLALWTVGAALFTGLGVKSLKNLLNPILIATAVGTALFVLNLRLPGPLLSFFSQLSGLNTPLAMLVLGARMDTLRPRHMLDGRMWLAVGMKLAVMPLAVLCCLMPLHLSPMVMGVLVLGSAMPTGATVQMQAEATGADSGLAARCISVSCLMSALTIPLILAVL